MADEVDISRTYDYMDEIFRASFGDFGAITAALFNGDKTLSLEQAQDAKHDLILDFLQGRRLLDIGCGWGPLLRAAQLRGINAVGITLSSKQAASCSQRGLQSHLLSWESQEATKLGAFDSVACVGGLEHFCTPEDHASGNADAKYESFFEYCASITMPGSKLYVQTMVLGQNAPPYHALSLKAPKDSPEYIGKVVELFYDGSWPASSKEQVVGAASRWYRPVFIMRGRDDYILTMKHWGRLWRPSMRKAYAAAKLVPAYISDPRLRLKVHCLRKGYNRQCFERDMLDHYRIGFERL